MKVVNHPFLAHALRLSIGLTALVTLYFAFHFLTASIYALATERNIDYWTKHSDGVTLEQVNETKLMILKALQHHRDHPHYHNLLGKVYEWEAYLGDDVDKESRLLNAKKAYLESALLRPTWSDTWVDLLVIETQLKGENIALYFAQADRYGPFTPKVNNTLSQIGLNHWSIFSAPQRTIIIDHAARALAHPQSRGEAYQYLKSNGLLKFTCAAIIYNPQRYTEKNSLCKRALE